MKIDSLDVFYLAMPEIADVDHVHAWQALNTRHSRGAVSRADPS